MVSKNFPPTKLVIVQPKHPPALTPPLKWAGGKRWLVPFILPLWTPYKRRRLVEPFCGGLGISMGLNPRWALLNDINPHAISFYQSLQKGFRRTLSMQNEKEYYYYCRERFNSLIEEGRAGTPLAAQLFYYLNRTGYNGLCRFNRSGFYNVPFGKYRTINYLHSFDHYRTYLKNWKFRQGDFERIRLKRTDFIYADPPYDVEFTQYSKEPFHWEEQVRLAEWLARHPGPVIISNQATPRIRRLYRKLGFKLRYLPAPRRISCKGDRKPAKEVLATKGFFD